MGLILPAGSGGEGTSQIDRARGAQRRALLEVGLPRLALVAGRQRAVRAHHPPPRHRTAVARPSPSRPGAGRRRPSRAPTTLGDRAVRRHPAARHRSTHCSTSSTYSSRSSVTRPRSGGRVWAAGQSAQRATTARPPARQPTAQGCSRARSQAAHDEPQRPAAATRTTRAPRTQPQPHQSRVDHQVAGAVRRQDGRHVRGHQRHGRHQEPPGRAPSRSPTTTRTTSTSATAPDGGLRERARTRPSSTTTRATSQDRRPGAGQRERQQGHAAAPGRAPPAAPPDAGVRRPQSSDPHLGQLRAPGQPAQDVVEGAGAAPRHDRAAERGQRSAAGPSRSSVASARPGRDDRVDARSAPGARSRRAGCRSPRPAGPAAAGVAVAVTSGVVAASGESTITTLPARGTEVEALAARSRARPGADPGQGAADPPQVARRRRRSRTRSAPPPDDPQRRPGRRCGGGARPARRRPAR